MSVDQQERERPTAERVEQSIGILQQLEGDSAMLFLGNSGCWPRRTFAEKRVTTRFRR